MAVKYKKPRAINTVSVFMVLLLGLAVYFGIYAWPVYSLSSRAKGVLLDHLPTLWRANLLNENATAVAMDKLRVSLPLALRKAGVKDPNLKLVFTRNKKEVSIQANFAASAFFPGIDKEIEFNLSPRAVTDAARVEW